MRRNLLYGGGSDRTAEGLIFGLRDPAANPRLKPLNSCRREWPHRGGSDSWIEGPSCQSKAQTVEFMQEGVTAPWRVWFLDWGTQPPIQGSNRWIHAGREWPHRGGFDSWIEGPSRQSKAQTVEFMQEGVTAPRRVWFLDWGTQPPIQGSHRWIYVGGSDRTAEGLILGLRDPAANPRLKPLNSRWTVEPLNKVSGGWPMFHRTTTILYGSVQRDGDCPMKQSFWGVANVSSGDDHLVRKCSKRRGLSDETKFLGGSPCFIGRRRSCTEVFKETGTVRWNIGHLPETLFHRATTILYGSVQRDGDCPMRQSFWGVANVSSGDDDLVRKCSKRRWLSDETKFLGGSPRFINCVILLLIWLIMVKPTLN
jgi:hypothetical protein